MANGAYPKENLLEFLDRFRGGEAFGEELFGAWIAACETPSLCGGLRTIQQREGFHARLLAERLKELGGSPRFDVPEEVRTVALESVASPERTDGQKLADFLRQVGTDIDQVLRPIHDVADRLDEDPETQSLLRTIAQDERATLVFLSGACEALGISL